VVVENFRPGVTRRMGLDYETLSAINPRLVYATITGYGHTGPWQRRRAYAAVVQAEAGYMDHQSKGSGLYTNDMMSHADVYTALECLTGLLAALYQRERTGQGQWVEVSMAETMLCVNDHTHWELTGRDAEPGAIPNFGPGDYPVLELANGRRVLVAGHPVESGTFEKYVTVMERPDLLDDPRLADRRTRVGHLDVVLEALHAWAATVEDETVLEEAFAAQGVAIGVVRTVQEITESEWAEERGAIVEVDDRGGGSVLIPNSPWHFGEAVTGVRGAPAYRGEHNRDVFGRLLGLDDGALDRLEADGVLTSRVPTR